jgi:hypothetical protein
LNELTGHPKDHGKDRPNLGMNSLQHGENDADQIEFRSLSVTALDPTIEHPPALNRTLTMLKRTWVLMLISCILVINYNSISLF